MHNTQSQKELILMHLINGRALTQGMALYSCRCARLASRIHELRSDGWQIESEFVRIRRGLNVKKYFMKKSLNTKMIAKYKERKAVKS